MVIVEEQKVKPGVSLAIINLCFKTRADQMYNMVPVNIQTGSLTRVKKKLTNERKSFM